MAKVARIDPQGPIPIVFVYVKFPVHGDFDVSLWDTDREYFSTPGSGTTVETNNEFRLVDTVAELQQLDEFLLDYWIRLRRMAKGAEVDWEYEVSIFQGDKHIAQATDSGTLSASQSFKSVSGAFDIKLEGAS